MSSLFLGYPVKILLRGIWLSRRSWLIAYAKILAQLPRYVSVDLTHKSRHPESFTIDRNCRRRSITAVNAEAETNMVALAHGDSCWTRHDAIFTFAQKFVRLST